MRKAATKALYLFLCSILGMVLFAMLHRALFVLYDLVLMVDYGTYSLGMSQAQIIALDFCTMLVALFLGGWYGTLLGIDWYSMVYGPNAETRAGLFHGFVPHNWRKGAKKPAPAPAPEPVRSEVTIKPVAKPAAKTRKASAKPAVKKAEPKSEASTFKLSLSGQDTWSFEDFLKATPAPKKRAVPPVEKVTAKKTVRKTARKSTAKRTVKTTVSE